MKEIFRNWRLPLILSLVAISAIFLAGHATSRIYPWPLVIFFVGMAALTLLAVCRSSYSSVIVSGVLLAIAFRLYTNWITTPIGASPQGQPRRMDRILETGIIETGSSWYNEAPIHFLLTPTYSSIAGISSYDGILLYSLLMSVILALVAIGLLRLLGIADGRVLATGVILVLVTTEGLRRSYWVVPQVTGTLLLWLTYLIIARYITNPSKRLYGVLAVFIGTLVFTHKFPVVFLTMVFGGLLLLLATDYVTWDDVGDLSPVYQIGGLVTFMSAAAAFQVVYVELLSTIVRRVERMLVAILASEPDAIRDGSGGGGPDAAVPVRPGIIADFHQYPLEFMLFVERGHGIWLLAAAGLAWVVLFLFCRENQTRGQLQFLLAISAVGVSLMFFGVFAIGGMNPTRPLFMIEPVLIVLIVTAVWALRDEIHIPARTSVWSACTGVFFVLLVASQVFGASAAPDYANTPRYYADAPEAKAETTLCEFADGDIHVDHHYSRFADSEKGSCSAFTSFGMEPDSDLFEGNVTPETYETVAFRHHMDVYLGVGDRWELTWGPETKLPREYHSVYSNDAVTIYTIN